MELGGSEAKELGSLSWDVSTERCWGLGCFGVFFHPQKLIGNKNDWVKEVTKLGEEGIWLHASYLRYLVGLVKDGVLRALRGGTASGSLPLSLSLLGEVRAAACGREFATTAAQANPASSTVGLAFCLG